AIELRRWKIEHGTSLDEAIEFARYGVDQVASNSSLEEVLSAGAQADLTLLIPSDIDAAWSSGAFPRLLGHCVHALRAETAIVNLANDNPFPKVLAEDPAFPLRNSTTHEAPKVLRLITKVSPGGEILSLELADGIESQRRPHLQAMHVFEECIEAATSHLDFPSSREERHGMLCAVKRNRSELRLLKDGDTVWDATFCEGCPAVSSCKETSW
ncbi:MAG: hypothetical protein ABIO70_17355, partial [Pseudomonadota bacterium]